MKKKKRGARRSEVSDPLKKPKAVIVSIGKIPFEAKLYIAMSLDPWLFTPIPWRLRSSGSNRIRIEKLRRDGISKADKMIRAFVRWETGAVSNMTHDEKLKLRKKIHRATRVSK